MFMFILPLIQGPDSTFCSAFHCGELIHYVYVVCNMDSWSTQHRLTLRYRIRCCKALSSA